MCTACGDVQNGKDIRITKRVAQTVNPSKSNQIGVMPAKKLILKPII